jgi:NarL family two-component system response regulator LiaR
MLRIIIADDHATIAESLYMIISNEPDMEVVATARDGAEAVEMCKELSPDIILMDIKMPVMSGIKATELVKRNCPETKVVVLTSCENKKDILELLEKNVDGYLFKDTQPSVLVMIIRCVCRGYYILNDYVKSYIVQLLREKEYSVFKEHIWAVEDMDKQILSYLSEGKTNREIAQKLSCTEKEIVSSVEKMLDALGVENHAQLIIEAMKHNVI